MTTNTEVGEYGHGWRLRSSLVFAVLGLLASTAPARAQDVKDSTMEVYGFVMLDMGYEANQMDPDWRDAARPTKLPSFDNEFGADGHWLASVKQTRLGVKTSTPTGLGDLKTTFEFELFGTGADAGQTTFRLRHAYGELGQFGAGQTWSPFMDIDIFPNSIEYWGPNGMVFFRNVQLRWMPIQGDTRLTIALERPGASADQGDYDDRIELDNVTGHTPYPDLSAEYRLGRPWGYVELAGILRYVEWEDNLDDAFDLSGDEVGWGLNLTSNIKLDKNVLRLGVVYGEGVQNYMNDAPEDIGIENNFSNPTRPIEGKALPMLGVSAFFDLNWSESMTSTIGYSFLDIDNSSGQSPDAFQRGDYALANVLFYPVKNLMYGPEVIWIRRENNSDGFTSDDVRVQFSVKYNFSHKFGGT